MTTTQQTYIREIQSLITGIEKHAPNIALTIASQTYTSAQLVLALQALITSSSAVLTTKTAWHDAVQGNLKTVAQNAPLVSELRQTVGLMFSNAEATLADFGLTPRKPRKPLSADALVARAAKAKATRAARGTSSKKQRATVSGNVTGVSITPIVLPAPAPSATSSPTAPAAGPGAPAVSSVSPGTPPQVVSAATNGAAAVASGASHA